MTEEEKDTLIATLDRMMDAVAQGKVHNYSSDVRLSKEGVITWKIGITTKEENND